MNESTPARIAVCRDGPRGWHWIKLENFDPSRHVLYPPEPTREQTSEAKQPEPVAIKRTVGRPRKTPK
jgi:hypothetical protein